MTKYFPYKIDDHPVTLLDGKPYVSEAKTNILDTFRRMGWVPPSEKLKQTESQAKTT